MDNEVVVTNIQRFSLQDGPGIRTTVFFKGCNLRCPWCSNPENLNFSIENYNYNNEEKGTYGFYISLEELFKEIVKDREFFSSGGGVTFSGGECLLQFKTIEPLLKKLQDNKINICVETALAVSEEYLDIALKYVDIFYIDMKILDNTAKNKINCDIDIYKRNIIKVFNYNKRVIVRIPIVKDYTYTENNIKKILEFLKELNYDYDIEIFKIHRLGEKKYNTLGREMPQFEDITNEEIKNIENRIKQINKNTKIIKI